MESSYHGYITEAAPVGTTVSTNSSLSTALSVIALDNDIEEVGEGFVSSGIEPRSSVG